MNQFMYVALKQKEMKAEPAKVVTCSAYNKPQKPCSTCMATFRYLYDFLADPFVYLLLLKSSMDNRILLRLTITAVVLKQLGKS